MPRQGISRTHTGCITCKTRRVKCDETKPSCIKCTSSGRKCDGYSVWVPKALRPYQPSAIPATTTQDLENLGVFRCMVAPVLAGPLPRSFWTHMVPQMTHHETAIMHATIAISSLFKNSQGLRTDMSKGTSAIFHYNTAIQQVIVSRHKNLDTVVITCILFISIELLRGNLKGAWMHYRHGREVLASYDAPQQLLCIFRQLNTFALFFYDVSGLSPLNKAGFPPPGGPFTNITQAQESLDFLLYRSMKIAFDLGKGISTGYVRRGVSRRRKLRDDLKTWSHAVSSLKRDSTHNEALYQALEARSLVCEIWTDPALYEYQEHYSKPEESNVGSIGEFLSSTRIPTVLNFMLMESQNMRLQLAALALLRAKYYASEMARDCKTLYDTARKTIEDDYDIKLGSEWNEASELDNLMGIREGAPQTKFKGAQFRCPWVFVVLDVCDRVGQSIAQ